MRLIFCLISVICIALGIYLYLKPNFLSLPGEGVMQAISTRFSIPLHKSKTIFDCTAVVVSLSLSLCFLRNVQGVREGTLISALCVGMCLKFIQKLDEKYRKSKSDLL